MKNKQPPRLEGRMNTGGETPVRAETLPKAGDDGDLRCPAGGGVSGPSLADPGGAPVGDAGMGTGYVCGGEADLFTNRPSSLGGERGGGRRGSLRFTALRVSFWVSSIFI